MISKKHILYSLGIVLLLFLLAFIYFNKNKKSDLFIDANTIVSAFIKNEEKANITYNNKVIEVSGRIKKRNYLNEKNTIILHGDNANSSIICELNDSQFQKSQTLSIDQNIIIKGSCKGFLKDVIFLDCYIVETNNNE